MSFDRITISGLWIQATNSSGSGLIARLGGSGLPTITKTTSWATLVVKSRNAVDFTNSENNSNYFSDDAKNVLLIPDNSDFGPYFFSGPGVIAGADSLYIKQAGVGVHNISLTHTYEDGCVVTQTEVYTIFNHNDAIAGINKSSTAQEMPLLP